MTEPSRIKFNLFSFDPNVPAVPISELEPGELFITAEAWEDLQPNMEALIQQIHVNVNTHITDDLVHYRQGVGLQTGTYCAFCSDTEVHRVYAEPVNDGLIAAAGGLFTHRGGPAAVKAVKEKAAGQQPVPPVLQGTIIRFADEDKHKVDVPLYQIPMWHDQFGKVRGWCVSLDDLPPQVKYVLFERPGTTPQPARFATPEELLPPPAAE